MIRGLLLDFYGTVVEDDDEIMAAIADDVAARATRPVSGGEVGAAWARAYQEIAEGTPFRSLRDSARESLAAVMADVGCAGDAAELYASQVAYWRIPPMRPGTREFLAGVKVPICVVSDADRDDLEAAMTHHGLTFDAVVTSQDVAAYKPARVMFSTALAALALRPHEVLHVGDSLRTDIAGAHAAGIRAAWINRRSEPVPATPPITHVLTSLSDLAAHLP